VVLVEAVEGKAQARSGKVNGPTTSEPLCSAVLHMTHLGR
jgi:hypothetical protein